MLNYDSFALKASYLFAMYIVLSPMLKTVFPFSLLFEQWGGACTYYECIALLVILTDASLNIFSHAYRGSFKDERDLRTSILRYLGFQSRNIKLQLLFGILAGIFFAFSFPLIFSHNPKFLGLEGVKTAIIYNPSYFFGDVLITPIFEEIIFRGYYISRLLELHGESIKTALAAIILSGILFGYIHYYKPFEKVFGGMLLALMFLIKSNKNIYATISAHCTRNLFWTVVQ